MSRDVTIYGDKKRNGTIRIPSSVVSDHRTTMMVFYHWSELSWYMTYNRLQKHVMVYWCVTIEQIVIDHHHFIMLMGRVDCRMLYFCLTSPLTLHMYANLCQPMGSVYFQLRQVFSFVREKSSLLHSKGPAVDKIVTICCALCTVVTTQLYQLNGNMYMCVCWK